MTSPGECIMTFDVGTSSVKGALYDERGEPAGTATAPLVTDYPRPGWAEQDPAHWLRAVASVSRTLLERTGTPAHRVTGVSFCAQMAGTVAVDAAGTPLAPALIWLDSRSADIAQRLLDGWPRVSGFGLPRLLRWLRVTNGAPSLSGKDPTSKILWLREARPDLWPRIARVLDVKDFLLHASTGRFVTSPDCAHLTWLMDSRTRAWSAELLDLLDLTTERLPEIVEPTVCIGSLTPDAAQWLGLTTQTRVFPGVGDLAAFALAAGDIGVGVPHACLGTSAWCAAHVPGRKVIPHKAIGSLRAAEAGQHLLIAAQETAGACLERVGTWLCDEPGEVAARSMLDWASASVPGARGLTFQPWLYGERAPVDDENLRGGFLGLSLTHERADLARAVLEGMVVNLDWVVRAITRAAGTEAREPVRLLGGCAQSALLAQCAADAFERPVLTMQAPQWGGTFGAMACARVGLGLSSDLAEASSLARVERRFEPTAAGVEALADVRTRFLAAHRALRPWYRRFTSLSDQPQQQQGPG